MSVHGAFAFQRLIMGRHVLTTAWPMQDIKLFINSPGGSVTAGMGIYDAMQVTSLLVLQSHDTQLQLPTLALHEAAPLSALARACRAISLLDKLCTS